MMPSSVDLLDRLLEQIRVLRAESYDSDLDTLEQRGSMYLEMIYGKNSDEILAVRQIIADVRASDASNFEEFEADFEDGRRRLVTLLQIAKEKEDLEQNYRKPDKALSERSSQPAPPTNSVFVVHGHDGEVREAVARVIERLGLEAIILHEKTNKGRTIVEKLVEESDKAGFAVVLLTPDDVGRKRDADTQQDRPRARQNVVLELGYFLGKLGRSRVMAIYKPEDNFEIPSDYDGVVYSEFDAATSWRYRLAEELRAAGYRIDLNRLASGT